MSGVLNNENLKEFDLEMLIAQPAPVLQNISIPVLGSGECEHCRHIGPIGCKIFQGVRPLKFRDVATLSGRL